MFDKEFSKHQLCRYNQGASRDLIYCKPVLSKSKVYVPLTLTIMDDLTWSVCVNEGVEISSTHECFRNLPQNLNDGNIGLFAEEFSTFKTCSGNQDFEGLLERCIDFKEEVRLHGLNLQMDMSNLKKRILTPSGQLHVHI